MWRITLVFSACATALLGVSVVLLASFGQDFVASLDSRLGEVIATEARAAQQVGDTERAMQLFQSALQSTFDDPRQRQLSAQDFARLAIDAGRYDDAISALTPALATDPDDGWNYSLLFEAYRRAGRSEDAYRIAVDWVAMGRRLGDAGAQRWALYNLGVCHRNAGRMKDAFDAFRESFEVFPNENSAFQAAAAAEKVGNVDAARELTAWVLSHGEGQYTERATDLQQRLTERQ